MSFNTVVDAPWKEMSLELKLQMKHEACEQQKTQRGEVGHKLDTNGTAACLCESGAV